MMRMGLTILVVLGSLSGCADGSRLNEVQDGILSVRYPKSWQVVDVVKTFDWPIGVERFHAARAGDGVTMWVSGDFSNDSSSTDVTAVMLTPTPEVSQMEYRQPEDSRSLKIEGANNAQVARYTYRSLNGQTLQGVRIGASRYPKSATVAVLLSGKTVPDQLVNEIVSGMRVSAN